MSDGQSTGGEYSDAHEELGKGETPERFEVIKFKKDPDGRTTERKTVMEDETPISKEQAGYELGGFESGYKYRHVAINARRRIMDSNVVEQMMGPGILWEISGAESSGGLNERIDAMKEIANIDLSSGAVKSMAWLKGLDLLRKIQDPDYTGRVFSGASNGEFESDVWDKDVDDEIDGLIELAEKIEESDVNPRALLAGAYLSIADTLNELTEEGRTWEESPLRDPDWLREQYWEEGRSATDIAKELSVGSDTVRRWMNRHGIDRRDASAAKGVPENSLLRDPEWMRKQYREEELSTVEIADKLGYSPSTVGRWIERHGIEL